MHRFSEKMITFAAENPKQQTKSMKDSYTDLFIDFDDTL